MWIRIANSVNRQCKNIGWTYANKNGLNNKVDQCFIAGKKVKTDLTFAKKFKSAVSSGLKNFYREHPEKIRKGKDNPKFGKPLSKETRKKISESISGSRNPMSSRMWIRNPITKESKV